MGRGNEFYGLLGHLTKMAATPMYDKIPSEIFLLLWHMVGQGPAVLAGGAGQDGLFIIFFISSILSSFSNALSLWRQLYQKQIFSGTKGRMTLGLGM